MVHFLRNKSNRTIIETSVYNNDLHTSTSIAYYTIKFVKIFEEDKAQAIDFSQDIDNLSEIRGLWWEKEMDFGNWKSIDDFVEHQYKLVAKKWNLNYVTD